MSYIKGTTPNKAEAKAIAEVAEWIDTEPIAGAIAEALADMDIEPTTKRMKAVWGNFLETELFYGLEMVIREGGHEPSSPD